MDPDDTKTLCIGPHAGVCLSGHIDNEPPTPEGFDSPPSSSPLSIEVIHGPPPPLESPEMLFDSKSLWKVSRTGETFVFELPHLTALIDFTTSSGRIYMPHPNPRLPAFDYPLDEVVFSKLLADSGSVIVHACGVEHRGRGLLLAGDSGAGKSTLASLFDSLDDARVLSDDRIAVDIRQNRPWISGTPWHGTSRHALNRSAPLDKIFFLQHANRNHEQHLKPLEAASRLVSLSVIPHWHRESSQKALDVAAEAAARVPASVLGFVPDITALQHIIQAPEHADR